MKDKKEYKMIGDSALTRVGRRAPEGEDALRGLELGSELPGQL